MGKVTGVKDKKGATTKELSLSAYIAKYARQLSLKEGKKNRWTMTGEGSREVALLIDDAVQKIIQQADGVLRYSQTETFGEKTAKAAMKMHFSGLLRDQMHEAGQEAVLKYKAQLKPAKPKAPKAPKAVAAGGD